MFRKSSYSVNNGQCVEVDNGVLVRDSASTNPNLMIRFTDAAWTYFLNKIKNGDFVQR